MKLEKAWMTLGIVTFLTQVTSLMLDVSGVISVLVLGLFVVGCGLSFASLFKLVHRFTTSTQMRVQDHVTVKHEPEVKPKVLDNMKVTEESEDAEWKRKLERDLHLQGGE